MLFPAGLVPAGCHRHRPLRYHRYPYGGPVETYRCYIVTDRTLESVTLLRSIFLKKINIIYLIEAGFEIWGTVWKDYDLKGLSVANYENSVFSFRNNYFNRLLVFSLILKKLASHVYVVDAIFPLV